MTHSVDVLQLTSSSNKSFLNVDCEDGHIGVWFTVVKKLTYLVKMTENEYEIIQFDDEEWAKEWFDNNMGFYLESKQI